MSLPALLTATRHQCCEALAAECALPAEQRVLLETALISLERLPSVPVPQSMKARVCREFADIAAADPEQFTLYRRGTTRYEELLHVVSLKRFPAGQFEWEIGGISRSDLLGVPPRQFPGALWYLGTHMRGLGPVFFSHLNPRRPNRSLSEEEALRSYHRMAGAMMLQPEIIGFAACSWFRAPSTHHVSPHLAWMSRVFVDNGGLVVDARYDDPESGVLARSQTRRRLYEEGTFRPRRGLAMWARDRMIAWAKAHPEFSDEG